MPTADVVGRMMAAEKAEKAGHNFKLKILTRKEEKKRLERSAADARQGRRKWAVLHLERAWRMRVARKERFHREAAVALQRRYRGWHCRRQLCKLLAARTIQYFARRRDWSLC